MSLSRKRKEESRQTDRLAYLGTKVGRGSIYFIMQNILIRILTPVYDRFIEPLDTKVRELCVWFIFLIFAAFFILQYSAAFTHIFYTETQRHLIGTVLLFAAAVLSMDRRPVKISWNYWVMGPLLIGAAGIIITGCIHNLGSGFFVFGLMLMFVYPCLYFVWANRADYERLFDIISHAFVVVGLCFAVYSAAFIMIQPETSEVSSRISGPMTNPNLFSMTGMFLVCCALYLLYRRWAVNKARWFYGVSAAAGLIVTVAGESRTSAMAVIAAIIVLCIFTVKNIGVRKRTVICAVGIAIIILFISVVIVAVIAQADKTNSTGGADKQITIIDRFSLSGKDVDAYSSGRIHIWRAYADNLNVIGHDPGQIDIKAMTNSTVVNAHNNFLEFGFLCGVPVAIVLCLLELIAGLISVKYLFASRGRYDYMLFCCIFTIVFIIESLLEIAVLPMQRYAPFFFYILLCSMAHDAKIEG